MPDSRRWGYKGHASHVCAHRIPSRSLHYSCFPGGVARTNLTHLQRDVPTILTPLAAVPPARDDHSASTDTACTALDSCADHGAAGAGRRREGHGGERRCLGVPAQRYHPGRRLAGTIARARAPAVWIPRSRRYAQPYDRRVQVCLSGQVGFDLIAERCRSM